MTTKSLLTENKDFWKLLRRNFVVSCYYLSNFLFWFFVEIESTIPTNEKIIRRNISNVELQTTICDVYDIKFFYGYSYLEIYFNLIYNLIKFNHL